MFVKYAIYGNVAKEIGADICKQNWQQMRILYDMNWLWKLNFVSWIYIDLFHTVMETWEFVNTYWR